PQVRDGDGLDALLAEDGGHLAHAALVERAQHLPVPVDALVDPEPQIAVGEVGGPRQPRVEAIPLEAVAEVERVAEPSRADQADPRPVALDDRVRRDRRAVHEQRDPGEEGPELDPELARGRGEAALDRLLELVGRRVLLPEQDVPVRRENGEIGEGAADVDADRPAHGRSSPGRSVSSSHVEASGRTGRTGGRPSRSWLAASSRRAAPVAASSTAGARSSQRTTPQTAPAVAAPWKPPRPSRPR